MPPIWPAVAAATGYADQAHLTRESRQLAGLPPLALIRDRHGVPGLSGLARETRNARRSSQRQPGVPRPHSPRPLYEAKPST